MSDAPDPLRAWLYATVLAHGRRHDAREIARTLVALSAELAYQAGASKLDFMKGAEGAYADVVAVAHKFDAEARALSREPDEEQAP